MRPYPELSAVVYRLPFLPLKHYPSSFGCLNPQSKLVSERTRELATRKGQLISKAKKKIGNLQQAIRWVDVLGRQEPRRCAEVEAKRNIVTTKLVQTLAEVGVLVNKLASGCYLCNDK